MGMSHIQPTFAARFDESGDLHTAFAQTSTDAFFMAVPRRLTKRQINIAYAKLIS
jgi:hypothetical protein